MKTTTKQAVVIPLCLAALVVFGVALRRQYTRVSAPKWVREAPVTRIDYKSLEVITLTEEEWDKLRPHATDDEGANDTAGQRIPDGAFKNPKTGEYTMLPAITCASCGKQIPATTRSKCPLCNGSILPTQRSAPRP